MRGRTTQILQGYPGKMILVQVLHENTGSARTGQANVTFKFKLPSHAIAR